MKKSSKTWISAENGTMKITFPMARPQSQWPTKKAFKMVMATPKIRKAQNKFQWKAFPRLVSAAVQYAEPRKDGWILAVVTRVKTFPAELIINERIKNIIEAVMEMVRFAFLLAVFFAIVFLHDQILVQLFKITINFNNWLALNFVGTG